MMGFGETGLLEHTDSFTDLQGKFMNLTYFNPHIFHGEINYFFGQKSTLYMLKYIFFYK